MTSRRVYPGGFVRSLWASASGAAELLFEFGQSAQALIALAAFEVIDAWRIEAFAQHQSADRLLGATAAEPLREALGAAKSIRLQFVGHAVGPVGGDLVEGGLAAPFGVTKERIRWHWHCWSAVNRPRTGWVRR